MKASVTTVIVNWNKLDLLKKCLHALQSATVIPEHIVVVDNHSTDGSVDFISSLSGINSILLNKNYGGCFAYEAGIKKAITFKTDYIWLMDEDTEVNDQCLAQLIKAFKNHQDLETEKPLEIVSPLVVDVNGNSNMNNASETDINNKLVTCTFVGTLHKREVFERFRLPNPELFSFFDDIIFYMNVFRNGVEGLHFKEAQILHHSKGADLGHHISRINEPRSRLYVHNYFVFIRFKYGLRKFLKKLLHTTVFTEPKTGSSAKTYKTKLKVLTIGFQSLMFRIWNTN